MANNDAAVNLVLFIACGMGLGVGIGCVFGMWRWCCVVLVHARIRRYIYMALPSPKYLRKEMCVN